MPSGMVPDFMTSIGLIDRMLMYERLLFIFHIYIYIHIFIYIYIYSTFTLLVNINQYYKVSRMNMGLFQVIEIFYPNHFVSK